jgi:DNA-directed RNA polymerase specialized sigma subunit
MIRSEADYREALRQLHQDREIAERQRAELVSDGLVGDEVAAVMEPLLAFQAQLEQEIAWYENARRRNFPTVRRLTQIGQLLVALRIANGLTQRELAERLDVSEPVVSRDERNEYHGITVERAQRILDALQGSITLQVEAAAVSTPERLLASVD